MTMTIRLRKLLTAAAIAVPFLVLQSLGASAQTRPGGAPSATGLWEQIDDASGKSQGWFLIAERDGVAEGAIARMFTKPGENPNPVCSKCVGDQKNAPSLGLTIIKGMKRNGLKYEDGTILDPRDGKVYDAIMELSPDGQKLTVRGYLGISLFGRSQVWNRLPESALAEVDPAVIAAHLPSALTDKQNQKQPMPPQRPKGSPAKQ